VIDFVPNGHLRHLIGSLLPEGRQEAAFQALSEGDRAAVLEELEHADPGITERLGRTWAFWGSKSVHLWRVPKLLELGLESSRAALVASLDVGLDDGESVTLEPPQEPVRDRISWLRSDDPELKAIVRVTVPRLVQVDSPEGEQQVDSYTPIHLLVTFEDGLAEGYGGYTYGRRALKSLHGAIFADVPDDRSRQWTNEWIPPVVFTEGQVDTFTQQRGMALVNLKGPDPEEEFGAVEYDARVEDGAEVPFAGEERIDEQLDQDNEHRTYNVVYTHQDGYAENVKVRFTLGRIPHLTFVSRTSRDAMKWIIDELVAHVGP